MVRPDVEGIEAALENASPAPWEAYDEADGTGTCAWGIADANKVIVVMPDFIAPSNAKLCAIARNELPGLISYVKWLEAHVPGLTIKPLMFEGTTDGAIESWATVESEPERQPNYDRDDPRF